MGSLAKFWFAAWRGIAAIGSGLLLASAFPPMASAETAWVALVPLLVLAWMTEPARSFRYGFLSGAVFWLVGLSWLLALGRTGAPWPLAMLGWLALALYCALYTGAFLFIASFLIGRLGVAGKPLPADCSLGWRARQWALLVLIPLAWIGMEYWRGVLFTGFPWNALGISQFNQPAVIQVAAWGGVSAVSALVMLVNVGLTVTVLRFADASLFRRRSRLHPELMLSLLVLLTLLVQGNRSVARHASCRPGDTSVMVRAVQPNIPQVKKWPETFSESIYDSLRDKTELALAGNSHLIVWPETALPHLLEGDPRAAAFTRDLAARGVPLLVGSLELSDRSGLAEARVETGPDGDIRWVDDRGRPWMPRYYNTAYLLDGRGAIAGRYRKRHLVPFGEYLPFDNRIGFIARLAPLGFSCDAGDEPTVFRLPPVAEESGGYDLWEAENETNSTEENVPRIAAPEREAAFSVLICFEDVFAYLSRDATRAGARFLVNQTNDAWFDGTSASVQHLAHAVFRCVENRVPMARSANTGVTGFIDRAGRLDEGTRTIIRDGTARQVNFRTERLCVPPADMAPTFYTLHGDRFLAQPAAIAAALGLALLAVRRRKQRKERVRD